MEEKTLKKEEEEKEKDVWDEVIERVRVVGDVKAVKIGDKENDVGLEERRTREEMTRLELSTCGEEDYRFIFYITKADTKAKDYLSQMTTCLGSTETSLSFPYPS